MKQCIKKTIRKTVIGFALLSGIVMAGGNPASAATLSDLKDANGNPVETGKKYYMESYAFPGQGLVYETWSNKYWTKLGSRPGEVVTFQSSWSGDSIRIKTDKAELEDNEIGLPVSSPLYLSIDSQVDGVKLAGDAYGDNKQWWIPTGPSSDINLDFTARNCVAFENSDTNKFISSGDSFGWLYMNKSNMDTKTMWRLIPQ
ncbi:hypothetical protein CUC43_32250 (plasmid) [Bacillus thuringiensis LM1212]|uniref:hypothetical protein n=1 Tax=Bacillus thuringiensis TaxID=1428 RepID=UPI000409884E|nr:hypothetical protein [Bacillus thuringiensis]AXY11299.1 hypothetical protein CUC43_32250 [Bacillus thuringiensis LM1212]QDF27201.1 hypothetical protein FJR70_30855 [Bacillus tropicus]